MGDPVIGCDLGRVRLLCVIRPKGLGGGKVKFREVEVSESQLPSTSFRDSPFYLRG